MPIVWITVEGTPVGKARARILANGRAYTPAKTAEYEEAIGWAAKQALLESGLDMCSIHAPIFLRVSFHFPLPKSWSKAKKNTLAGEPHCQKPDLDNLVKTVKDACQGIIYADDALVYYTKADKRWCHSGQDGFLSASFYWRG